MTREEKAKAIVDGIISDFTSRSGGDGFWGGIDEDTKNELREVWLDIARLHLTVEGIEATK